MFVATRVFVDTRVFVVTRLSVLVFALGCGAERIPAEAPSTHVAVPVEQTIPPAGADSLRTVLDVPAAARVGQPIPITLILENVSGRELTLYLTGRPTAFDIVVRDASGAIVWQRLAGLIPSMVLRVETMPPGGRIVLSDEWDAHGDNGRPVPMGTYTVRGEVLTDSAPLMSATNVLVLRR